MVSRSTTRRAQLTTEETENQGDTHREEGGGEKKRSCPDGSTVKFLPLLLPPFLPLFLASSLFSFSGFVSVLNDSHEEGTIGRN